MNPLRFLLNWRYTPALIGLIIIVANIPFLRYLNLPPYDWLTHSYDHFLIYVEAAIYLCYMSFRWRKLWFMDLIVFYFMPEVVYELFYLKLGVYVNLTTIGFPLILVSALMIYKWSRVYEKALLFSGIALSIYMVGWTLIGFPVFFTTHLVSFEPLPNILSILYWPIMPIVYEYSYNRLKKKS